MDGPVLPVDTHGQGPPVVLVHGAAPAATWGSLPDVLAAEHEVVTYARRGFPPNDHLSPARSLRQHTDDLASILDAIGPAVVAGWSSGGVIALDLCLQRPDLLHGAVILEAPLHAKRRPSFGQLRAVVGAVVRSRRSPKCGARRFLAWALARRDGRPTDLERLNPAALEAAAAAIMREVPHATGEREISRHALSSLSVDVRWLVGDQSVGGAERLARRAARRSPRIEIVTVPGAGHAIALDAPEAIVDAVRAFRYGRHGPARSGKLR